MTPKELPPEGVRLDGRSAYIRLANGLEAIVNAGDVKRVAAYTWSVEMRNGLPHAVKRWERQPDGRRRVIYLHRFVMGETDPSILIDHRNGNALDCRRRNLRRACSKTNGRNKRRSINCHLPYKGVERVRERYRARLCVEGRVIKGRVVSTPRKAARAYDVLARQHHGTFAALNFPKGGEVRA